MGQFQRQQIVKVEQGVGQTNRFRRNLDGKAGTARAQQDVFLGTLPRIRVHARCQRAQELIDAGDDVVLVFPMKATGRASGVPVERDPVQAYQWFSIAAQNLIGREADTARQARDSIRGQLTPEQVARGDAMVKAWRATPESPGPAAATPRS